MSISLSSHRDRSIAPRPIPLIVGGTGHCGTCGVRHASVCGALDDAQLARLAALAISERIAPNRIFVQEGDAAAAFFNVKSGTARLFKLLPDGRRQITGFAGPGYFLGLAATARYAFSAEAVDELEICRFSRPKLHRLLHDFPALERRLLEVAVSELVIAEAHMLLLGRKTARERVASFLFGAAESGLFSGIGAGRPCHLPSTHLHLPMSRTDIADYLGLTIETISRTFTRLKSERLIALHGAADIEILDAEKLHLLACAEA